MSFISFVRSQYAPLPVASAPPDIAQGVYVVTGANTGLGLECAKHLARMGCGRLVLAVRSPEKGANAVAEIRAATDRPGVGEVWPLDMASLDSVEAFARRLAGLARVDALVLNAGVVAGAFQPGEGDTETTVMVNVVATMLLVLRALPVLQKVAATHGIQPRLVVVSSSVGLGGDMQGSVDKRPGQLFDALSVESAFSVSFQYQMSKLLEVYAVRQLAALVPLATSRVIVNLVNPGLCYSALDRNGTPAARFAMAVFRRLLARTTEQGSRTLLHAALAGPESHGKFCSQCQVMDQLLPSWVTDAAGQHTQERVWNDLLDRLASMGHPVSVSELSGPWM